MYIFGVEPMLFMLPAKYDLSFWGRHSLSLAQHDSSWVLTYKHAILCFWGYQNISRINIIVILFSNFGNFHFSCFG